MKHKRNLITVSLIAAATLCLIGLGHIHAQGLGGKKAIGPAKIAVCDILEIVNKSQRSKDLKEQLQKDATDLRSETEKRQTELASLQGQLEGLMEGKPEHKKLLSQIQQKIIGYKVWSEMEQKGIMAKNLGIMKEMYKLVEKTVAEIAKEQGLDLIIQFDPRDLTANSAQELAMKVQTRKVLYSAQHLDITAEVLQRFDESYRVTKKK